jgi:transcriptional regulator with XRE-family HTH domain
MRQKSPNPIDKYVGSRVRMRRLMLTMSQGKLAGALGLTFQQVQKYEKGSNRIGASRLQHIAHVLQVPVGFFFDGAPDVHPMTGAAEAPSPSYITDFLATPEGLSLAQSFMQVKDRKLRQQLVALVEEMGREAPKSGRN